MSALDWPKLMAAGLGRLALSPEAFWAMSPIELQAALQGAFGADRPAAPLRRRELDVLAARFPDHQTRGAHAQQQRFRQGAPRDR